MAAWLEKILSFGYVSSDLFVKIMNKNRTVCSHTACDTNSSLALPSFLSWLPARFLVEMKFGSPPMRHHLVWYSNNGKGKDFMITWYLDFSCEGKASFHMHRITLHPRGSLWASDLDLGNWYRGWARETWA